MAHAALAALHPVGEASRRTRVSVQGFGTLGRAAALSLAEAGATVVAVSDEFGSLVSRPGLDVEALLKDQQGTPLDLTSAGTSAQVGPPESLFSEPVDAVVLAACEEGLTADHAAIIQAEAVVVGANLGLSPAIESTLHQLGITVIPDFVGGCGGSA
ncbi:MAG: Glu/Leu/Phe/Val dehydrogenase dimerization domain-containing protein, partial [Acidimicrobiia bacterium]